MVLFKKFVCIIHRIKIKISKDQTFFNNNKSNLKLLIVIEKKKIHYIHNFFEFEYGIRICN